MTPDALTQLATGYWPAATLIAAVELGLFDQLDDKPTSAATLAERLATHASHTAALLDALAAIGLLDATDAGYAVRPKLRPLLARSSPTCMLDALAYNADLYRRWADLADVVRTGRPTPQAGQLGDDPALTARFVRGMEAKARAFAPVVAPLIDLGGVRRLLDVGSGPGTLSRLLAERMPGLAVTLLDLPPVLAVAADLCAASPATDRLSFHPADYRRDALPGGFDAVLYAGALHQETPASANTLLAGIGRALRPGGRVIVVDLLLDDGRTSPAFSALFQLNMLLIRPSAHVFAVGELRRLLEGAGFAGVNVATPDGSPYRVVTARRGG